MRNRTEPTDDAKPQARDRKSARLAEALRANLARRKAQKRARSEDAPAPDPRPQEQED